MFIKNFTPKTPPKTHFNLKVLRKEVDKYDARTNTKERQKVIRLLIFVALYIANSSYIRFDLDICLQSSIKVVVDWKLSFNLDTQHGENDGY